MYESVYLVCAFVFRALQQCLLAKYLRGVIGALETVFASCCSRYTYCLTKSWNTEESVGCSQWPRVKNCSQICNPKHKKSWTVEETECLIQREPLVIQVQSLEQKTLFLKGSTIILSTLSTNEHLEHDGYFVAFIVNNCRCFSKCCK